MLGKPPDDYIPPKFDGERALRLLVELSAKSRGAKVTAIKIWQKGTPEPPDTPEFARPLRPGEREVRINHTPEPQ